MGKRRASRKMKLLLVILCAVFIVYFAAVLYFSFSADPIDIIQTLTASRFFLLLLFLFFFIMFFLVMYNIVQVIAARFKNREGSKFRLRLTLFFLTVTLIPIVPVILVSNNIIGKSIDRQFERDMEGTLVDALDVSKELYRKYSEESINEWERICNGCPPEVMKEQRYDTINGILGFDPESGRFIPILLEDYAIIMTLEEMIKSGESMIDTWKRVAVADTDYLIIPVLSEGGDHYVLLRVIPEHIREYAASISSGLQRYRIFKISRKPLMGFVTLFFTVLTLPFVLLSFYLSLIISREVTGPIRELAIATQRVAHDDFEYTIETDAKDEMLVLIDSFNRMTEDLRLNKMLLKQTERSAAWRDIARKIAHEIKNPLTPIRLSAERILRLYERDDSYREILSKGIGTILTEVTNINDMVNEFSQFARFPDTVPRKRNIIAVLKDIMEGLGDGYRNISFSFNHDEDTVYLMIDEAQIRRAVLNIIYNSINAIETEGTIAVAVTPGKDRSSVVLSVTDNGPGIDPEIRDRIFDPYVSQNGRGSGLGLAIVERIVLDNKGRIWYESEPGRTTFFMEFDRA